MDQAIGVIERLAHQDRPGDPAYWNAEFGARLPRSLVADVDAAVAFWQEGLRRFA